MKQQTELLNGIHAYQQHDYLAALKHFSAVRQNPQTESQQLVLETLTAVTNLQLCNYNEAGKTLHRVRERLQQLQNQNALNSELIVVKCKVFCNLMILQLLNCNQTVNEYLQQLLDTVNFTLRRNRSMGIAVFKVSIKSLFGFQTFAEINSQIQHITSKKQINGSTLTSPIYCTALAIYAHLSGQHKQAYNLQIHAYQLAKEKHPLLAALSLRHLQELCVVLKNQKERKNHERELKKLMSSELEGVAQQTLFRNYDKKLQLASSIVEKLVKQEQLILDEQINQGLNKVAVVWKLKSMQRTNYSSKIGVILQLICQNKDVMGVMGQNEFVKEAVNEYRAAIIHLADTLSRISKNLFFAQFVKACKYQQPRIEIHYDTRRRMLEHSSQNYTQQIQVSRVNRSIDSNTSSRKKHREYATSFYLNKQAKEVTINQNKSNLVVNKPKRNQQSSTTLREKDNAIYKISKVDHLRVEVREQKGKGNAVVIEKQLDLRQYFTAKPTISNKQEPKPASKLNKQSNIAKIQKEQEKQVPNIRPKQKQSKPVSSTLPQKQKMIIIPQNSKIKQSSMNEPKEKELIKTTSNLITQSKLNKQIKPPIQSIKPSKLVPQIPNGDILESEQRFKRSEVPSFTSINARQIAQKKVVKIISYCQSGQYLEKRHFTSDGGAERFLQLNKYKDKISWGDNEESIDFNNSSASYSMNDIRGILYGKVTQTLRKQCNAKLDSTKCFSLVLKKRTLDFYCPKEADVFYWVPGISACLKDFVFQNEKYSVMKKTRGKQQRKICNKLYYDNRQLTRLYSVGRMLWKRFLMRLKNEFVSEKKKEKYRRYRNPNAFAIVAAAVKNMNFKSHLRDIS